MLGGPTLDGELRPPEITCIPDALDSPTDNVLQVPNSQSTTAADISVSRYSKNSGRRIASILLIAHLIEVAIMVVSTCFRVVPQAFKLLSTSAGSSSPSGHATSSTSSETSSPLLLGIHLGFILVPFTIMTAISLAWVLRIQDFSGRFVARLVCWILHLFQSSLLWRYLKVQMAYDPGDLAEFGMLRFIQIHIHTLPFLIMHLSTSFSVPRSLWLVLCVALALLVSTSLTVVLSSNIHHHHQSQPSSLALPIITQMCHMSTLSSYKGVLRKNDGVFQAVLSVTTFCILWSRVIALATLFCVHYVWAITLVILHWAIAGLWLSFQKDSSSNINTNRHIIHKIFLAYLLLWDWHSFREETPSEAVTSKPKLPAAYYAFISVQNISATSLWYASRQWGEIPMLWTLTFASVIVAQIIGLVLLTLSYMYSKSFLMKWPVSSQISRISLSKSRKSSLVTQAACKPPSDMGAKVEDNIADVVPSIDSPSFSDLPEVISNIAKEIKASSENRELHDSSSAKDSLTSKEKSNQIKHSLHLSPKLLSKNISSMYSFSHDILQQTKSERSSTENGSFNSRNTNTLPQSSTHLPDYDIVHQAHGSFSDSFSSLSCGTVNKNFTSTPKNALYNQISAHNIHRKKPLKLSKKDLLDKVDQLSQVCSDVEEEVQGSRLPLEDNIDDFRSLSSIEKSASPPKLTILTATQRLQVVCTKCLEAHDPLLTKCRVEGKSSKPPSLSYSCGGELGVIGGGSSTDYPSDTEVTTTIDSLSSFSAESHSTYTTWPVGRGPGLAKLLLKEKGGHDDYVTAWLRHQQRNKVENPSATSTKNDLTRLSKGSNPGRGLPVRSNKPSRRHGQRIRLRSPPAFIQDLETIV